MRSLFISLTSKGSQEVARQGKDDYIKVREEVEMVEDLDGGLHVVKTHKKKFELGEAGNTRRLGNASCNAATLIGRWHHHELYRRIAADFGG